MGARTLQFLSAFPAFRRLRHRVLAKELAQDLAVDAAAASQIALVRAIDDAPDRASILAIAAGSKLGAALIELAKDANKELVEATFHRAGQNGFDVLWYALRKWGTRATVEAPSGAVLVLGEEHRHLAAPLRAADAEALAGLKTLGLVILGASTFPNYLDSRKSGSEAFKRSAELIKKVLRASHTVFRKVAVLDLFDRDLDPDAIAARIGDHVAKHPDMRDLMLYYCGHGSLSAVREHTCYLLLKGTKPGREAATALGIEALCTMLDAKGVLTDRRCTVMLDCCFAGQPAGAWQNTGLDTTIANQIREVLPAGGLAFLTASEEGRRVWGRGAYEGATVFAGALAEVLTEEAPGIKRLPLSDLCAAMADRIRGRYDGGKGAAIPQCHAPGQRDGGISRIPMFLAGGQSLLGEQDAPEAGELDPAMDRDPGELEQPLCQLKLAAQEAADPLANDPAENTQTVAHETGRLPEDAQAEGQQTVIESPANFSPGKQEIAGPALLQPAPPETEAVSYSATGNIEEPSEPTEDSRLREIIDAELSSTANEPKGTVAETHSPDSSREPAGTIVITKDKLGDGNAAEASGASKAAFRWKQYHIYAPIRDGIEETWSAVAFVLFKTYRNTPKRRISVILATVALAVMGLYFYAGKGRSDLPQSTRQVPAQPAGPKAIVNSDAAPASASANASAVKPPAPGVDISEIVQPNAYYAHVAYFKDKEQTMDSAKFVRTEYADVLQGLKVFIKYITEGQFNKYSVAVGPFQNIDAAKDFCSKLKEAGHWMCAIRSD